MSQYRIMRCFDLNYPLLISSIYDRDPELANQDYATQFARVDQLGLVYLNGFGDCMGELGNECREVIVNLEPMQKAWAREHGKPYDEGLWQCQIVLHQILEFRPDVIYLQDVNPIPREIRRRLKRDFPFIKLVAMFKCFPHLVDGLGDLDLIFSSPRSNLLIEAAGFPTHLLYHCFDPRTSAKLGEPPATPSFPFTFAGATGFGLDDTYLKRRTTLDFLMHHSQLQCWTYEPEGVGEHGLQHRFPDRCQAPVFGIDLYRILHDSAITFNAHIDPNHPYVANMRLFEATGCGACLLTENGANMADLFDSGTEVVTYDSNQECLEKLTYLQEHEDVRRQIARAGRRRTLRDHTTRNRVQVIDEVVRKRLSAG